MTSMGGVVVPPIDTAQILAPTKTKKTALRGGFSNRGEGLRNSDNCFASCALAKTLTNNLHADAADTVTSCFHRQRCPLYRD